MVCGTEAAAVSVAVAEAVAAARTAAEKRRTLSTIPAQPAKKKATVRRLSPEEKARKMRELGMV